MKDLQNIVNKINSNKNINEVWIKIDKIGSMYELPYKLSIQNRNNEATNGFYSWAQNRVEHFKTLAELRAAITTLELLAFWGGIK